MYVDISSSSATDDGESTLSEGGAAFCHAYELIGTALCGPTGPLTITFVCTVAILIVTEMLLKSVETLVRDTQFESVKNKVFQEMTGIGLLSFLTILINAGSNGTTATIPSEYLHDLHHADFVMFIMSSLYLAQISTHMYLSSYQYKKWKIAGGTQVCDLIEHIKPNDYSNKHWWWIGEHTVRDQMEYKILLSIFCRKFNIRKTDFNFAAYLNESFRGYILTLIEESFFVRIVFGALVGINILRVIFVQPTASWREHCDDECQATKLLIFYTCCGWALIISCAALVLVSRMYEFRLICRAGVGHVADYRNFLLHEEQTDIRRHKKNHALGARQDSLSLNKEDLKTTLQAIKEAREDDFDLRHESRLWDRIRLCFLYVYVSIVHRLGLRVNRSRLKSVDIAAMGLEDEQFSEDDSSSSSDSDEDNDDVESQSKSNTGDPETPAGRDTDAVSVSDKILQINNSSRKKRAKKILSKSSEVPSQAGGLPGHHNHLIKQMSFATLLTLRGAIKHTVGHEDVPAVPTRRTQDKRRISVAGSTGGRAGSHSHNAVHGHHQHDTGHHGPNRRKNTLASTEHVRQSIFSCLLQVSCGFHFRKCTI
jgi:hypothetical protein